MSRLMRRIFLWLVVLPVLVLFLMTESSPLVSDTAQPSGADVLATRGVVHQIRSATSVNAEPGAMVTISEGEVQSAMRATGRIAPGFRGSARIGASMAVLRVSIPLPDPMRRRWINIEALVPEFSGGLKIESLRIGRLKLPPKMVLFLGRIGLNMVLGDAAGDKILSAASDMNIRDKNLVFTMDLDRRARADIMASVFGVLRNGSLDLGDSIDAIYVDLRNAMENGLVANSGSLQPHLAYVMSAVQEEANGIQTEDRAAVALMALAKACGSWNFAFTIGGLSGKKPGELGQWSTSCGGVTLRDRTDSRLHFTTAAALRAASNRGFAVSVGEFKELSDSVSGGSGFDFSDLAANNSGIRVADYFSSLSARNWPGAISRLTSESAFVAPFAGLPPRMGEMEFAAQFGEIGSPAYNEILGEIEGRIDRLGLYN